MLSERRQRMCEDSERSEMRFALVVASPCALQLTSSVCPEPVSTRASKYEQMPASAAHDRALGSSVAAAARTRSLSSSNEAC